MAFLMDSVQSILNQTYNKFTLFLMNDDPRYDLKEYEKLDNRIEVFQDGRNMGQAFRLNQAVEKCNTEYIAFQDADDISIPERLEISINNIAENDLIYCDFIREGFNYWNSKYVLMPENFNINSDIFGAFASIFVRTEIAQRFKFKSYIGLGNDKAWWIELVVNNVKCRKINLPLYYIAPPCTSVFRKRINIPVLRKFHRIYRQTFKEKEYKKIIEQIRNEYR